MTVSRYIIYGLVDPRDGAIRYVGRSSKGLGRAKEHKRTANFEKTYKANWIRALVKQGLEFGIIVLEEHLTGSTLNVAEKRWIASLRKNGARLTNLTDGGGGMLGHKHSVETKRKLRGKLVTEETKRKLSIALQGNQNGLGREVTVEQRKAISKRSKGNHYATGHIRTEEHRQKLAEANKGNQTWKGRTHSEETKAKLRAKHIGKTMSKESCLKMSASQKRLWQDPIHRERMSKAHLGYKPSAKSVKKTRMGNLGQKRSSEARARMARSQRLRRRKERYSDCS